MSRTRVGRGSVAGAVLAVLVLAGCRHGGDLSFRNDGPDDVSVVVDGETSSIDAGGGMVILGAGCTDGDVLVTFPSGRTVTVAGPVCPDQEVVVHDDEVDLRPVTTTGAAPVVRPSRTGAATPPSAGGPGPDEHPPVGPGAPRVA